MAAVISVISTANGKETDGSPVVFSFSRTGDTNTALSVSYQLFGTAQAGSDYTGNTSGSVSFAAGSATATLSLPALADGVLIDPYETIIARINPATNYEIATGKQFAPATITAEGMVVIPKGVSYQGKSSGEQRNYYSFAALKNDGSVISWGHSIAGSAPVGLTGVSQIFSSGAAFAALKSDGSVVSWGASWTGSIAPAGLSGVNHIFSTGEAFAALKNDGSVISWGDSRYGGVAPAGLTGVSQIFSNYGAFAALKNDGSVISWGDSSYGGVAPAGLTGVDQIFSTESAFAALKTDGSVISWGNTSKGGAAPAGLTGVSQIFSTESAFAALKSDGSVISWGDSSFGANAPAGLTGISQIFSNSGNFAVLKFDGSVMSWGIFGTAPAGLTGVSQIFSTESAFAALKSDGSVVSWGNTSKGGAAPAGLTGVNHIFSTGEAFAALKNDGSVVSWGSDNKGGAVIAPVGLTGVSQIFSTGSAFAALKSDGSVIGWGDSDRGGIAPTGLTGVVGFANPYTDDRLEIAAIPTYTLSSSATSINEGAVLTSTVATTNVASGTKYYYALSGTGITTADFSAGALTGEIITDATGKFSFTHTLANDLITEGAETLSIKLYSDVARTLQVGSTATVNVVDSSTTPAPTYTLTPSATTINEGAVLTSTVTTTNLNTGTTLYYALSGNGITAADFSAGVLTGEGTTDATGKFSFSHTFAKDLTTEGSETLSIKLYSDVARTLQVGATAILSVVDSSNNLKKIDLSKSETDLVLNTKVIDASGLNSLNLTFSLANPPSGAYSTTPSAYIAIYSDKVSGTTKDGTYSSIVKVGGNALPGTYAISSLQIEDSIGNRIYKSGTDLDKYLVSIGIDKASLTFEVIGTTPETSDLLAPKISSASLSSKIVDLSKGETDLLLTTKITAASGFNYSNLSFSLVNPPSGTSYTGPSAYIATSSDKISGSTKDGTYSSIVKVGGNSLPGTYAISNLAIEDSIGNRIYKSGTDLDKYLVSIGIDKASLTFEVIGKTPVNKDSAEPKISSVTLSSKIVDLSKGETDLLLTTKITDASGFNSSYLSFSLVNPPSGGSYTSPSANIYIYSDKISGSTKDGTYSSIIKVGGNALPGTYAISSLSIEDSIGNRVYKSSNDLDKYLVSIGIDKASLTFEVIGTAPVTSDSAEPKLVSVKLESLPKIDYSSIPQIVAGSTITIELDFNDISGIGYHQNIDGIDSLEDNVGFIFIANPNYSQLIAGAGMYSFTRADIIKGTDKNGTLSKTIKLNDNAAMGQWYIQSLGIYDKSGNSLNTGFGNTVPASEIVKFAAKLGVTPESTSFNVINNNPSSTSDDEPPKITAIRFSSKEIAIGATGAEITLELDFNDISGISFQQNIEGVDSPDDYAGSISLANPNSPSMGGMQNYYSFTRADIIKGTDKNGTFRKNIKLTENAIPGKWYIQNLWMNDKSGNSLMANINTSIGAIPSASEVAKFAAKLGVPAESTSFNVINNNPVSAIDNEPPKITAIRFSSKEIFIGATGGEITFELDFNDISGIVFGQNENDIDSPDANLAYYSISNLNQSGQSIAGGYLTRTDIVKGTDKIGTFRKNIKLNENALPGKLYINNLWMNDKSGNSLMANLNTTNGSNLSTNEIVKFAAKLSVPAESISFDLVNNNPSSVIDNEPPKIASIRIFSESTPTPTPTFTLTPSATALNEGAVLTSTVTTTNVANNTKFYYALSGTGITTADFSAGAFTGEGTTDSAGKFTFAHTLANDLTTEGAESLSIKLYSDTARTLQVGSTATVSIADTSTTPLPQVSVIATANGKETDGSPVVFSFNRNGDTASALSVNYQLFGTAQAGSDYTGNTTGTVSFAAGSSSATLSLPALADGALIDPYETIIARINPDSSYGITTGKQFATATITAEEMVAMPKGVRIPGGSSGERRNLAAFAALKSDGSVVSWGENRYGGNAPAGLTGVIQIFTSAGAVAALKRDGSVVSWGSKDFDGGLMTAPAGLTGVIQIFSNAGAFTALKSDGSVVSWGNTNTGSEAPAGLTGVGQVFSTDQAFAALRNDGSVICWGSKDHGGSAPAGLTGVSQIFSTGSAFAALKSDGTVICWGDEITGEAPAGLTGVIQISSSAGSFAALKSDGSVVSWGGASTPALTGVSQIFSTSDAFAALKSDGSVVSWGDNSSGGIAPAGLTSVSQIFSNENAFAALKSDGTVVGWGNSSYGGIAPAGLTGVSQIFSTKSAFAALISDGSVASWGDSSFGGNAPAGLSGVSQIFSNEDAFAALKSDGTVVTWGGGDAANAPAGLTGVVGFANPFTDDRLVLDELTGKTLDFNGDGNVDSFDSILMMRHMMGTYPGESIKKDIPGKFDLTAIQRKLTNAFADTFSLNGGLRLDIDGDKRISAFRDGMMITQHIHEQGKSDSPWAPPGFNPPAGFPAQMQQHLKDLIGF